MVLISVEEWNKSKPKQIYSVVVLVLITICAVGSMFELNILNTAF